MSVLRTARAANEVPYISSREAQGIVPSHLHNSVLLRQNDKVSSNDKDFNPEEIESSGFAFGE